MIEKQFVAQKMKETQIQEYISSQLNKAGYSHTEIKRTPLGEKIIIYTARPGLVVGKKGENIQRLTDTLKKRFKMENPQIEIGEIKSPALDCYFMVDKIITTLERFGAKRFKSIGYSSLQEIMDAGAVGAEIQIGGRGVPSSRAKSWKFSAGYLKKSGDISENYIITAKGVANLRSGAVGVRVRILTPDIILPDKIHLKEKLKPETKTAEPKEEIKVEEITEEQIEEIPAEKEAEELTETKEDLKEKKPKKEGKPRKKKEIPVEGPTKEHIKESAPEENQEIVENIAENIEEMEEKDGVDKKE